jgi:hypothetical protein
MTLSQAEFDTFRVAQDVPFCIRKIDRAEVNW